MKSKCTAAFLSFVTDGNKEIRENLFSSCFPTFEMIKEANKDIQSVVIDNNSIGRVKDAIELSRFIDVRYMLDRNMFDTALFCAGLDASQICQSDYILFTYDDFFVYDPGALSSVIQFMDSSNVDCTRITDYSVKNSELYNSEITPKSKNPDAIRHTNIVTGKKIEHEFFGRVGNYDFFLTNWHYTSRPCVWRSSKLRDLVSSTKNLKILQGFEGFMSRACQESGVSFATLDKGMMRTFPVHLSARTSQDFVRKVDETSHTVSQETMNDALLRCRVITETR